VLMDVVGSYIALNTEYSSETCTVIFQVAIMTICCN